MKTPSGDSKDRIHLLLEAYEEYEESVQKIKKAVSVTD